MTESSRYAAPRVPVETAQPALERAHRLRIVELVVAFFSGGLVPLALALLFAALYRESQLQRTIENSAVARVFALTIVFVITFAGALPVWRWVRRAWAWPYLAYLAGFFSCVAVASVLSRGRIGFRLNDFVVPEMGCLLGGPLVAFWMMARLRHRAARA